MNISRADDSLSPDPNSGQLFDAGEPTEPVRAPVRTGVVRLKRAQRDQVVIRCLALDALLPAEHTARQVWAFVEGLDLTRLYQQVQVFWFSLIWKNRVGELRG